MAIREQDAERYAARTPLLHASNISVPVIFFQGELDAVVVPQQTRDMVKALQDNGILVEAHYYADERHGFRKAGNQAHALEQEWLFYRRVMALDEADNRARPSRAGSLLQLYRLADPCRSEPARESDLSDAANLSAWR